MNYFKNFPFHTVSILGFIIDFFVCNILGLLLLLVNKWLIIIPLIYWWIRLAYYAYSITFWIFKYFVNKILIEHKLIEPPKKVTVVPRITRRLPNQKR